jgi:transcriptional regulator with XRE-family HTH domain
MDVDRLIGWNFKRLRVKLGLSQEEVALRLGTFDQGYISQLEAGERNPTGRTLFRLAISLEASVGDLFQTADLPADIAEGENKTTGKSRSGRSLPKKKAKAGPASGT